MLQEETSEGQLEGHVSTSAAPQNMTEYCKTLEAWLMKVYCQRSLVTSAYFTALQGCTYYGATPPTEGAPLLNNNYIGQPPVQQPPPRVNLNNLPRWQRQPVLMFLTGRGRRRGGRGGQQVPGQGEGQGVGVNVNIADSSTISAAVVVKVAPVYKRILAEIIDFVFLLAIKIFITFTIIDSFDLIDVDNMDIDALRDADVGGNDDISPQLQNLLEILSNLTSELILLEITHRIVACVFEAYCLWKKGATPGKTLLGIRVISVEEILPFAVPRIQGQEGPFAPGREGISLLVRPASYLSFNRAFLRSAVKNFSLTFLFPLCFTLFTSFENSRTIYDLMSHSLVIEI